MSAITSSFYNTKIREISPKKQMIDIATLKIVLTEKSHCIHYLQDTWD